MPPRPLIESPRQQRQLVTLLMAVVLLASLGIAYLFGAARIGEFQTVQIESLRLEVPDGWHRDAEAEEALEAAGVQVYRNPDRPHQRLRVLPVRATTPTSPAMVLGEMHRQLLSAVELRTFQQQAVQVPSPGTAVQVADIIGFSQLGPAPQDVRVHLIAAMSQDGLHHWVLHLADRPGANEPPGRVLEQNAYLLRRMERFAVIEPADANDTGPADVPEP
ncbi:MAG: hypothetical protein WD118_09180 [Phycisphaeraceae bacterium]